MSKPTELPEVVIFDSAGNELGGVTRPIVVTLTNPVAPGVLVGFSTEPTLQSILANQTNSTQKTAIIASTLPVGAATEVSLAAAKIDLDAIAAAMTDGTQQTIITSMPVYTQPVSAASLPLPANAAQQTTLATLLTEAAYAAKTPTLGQKTMAGSVPVTMASNQDAIDVTISQNLDAFGRIRVAAPQTLFDSKMTSDNSPLYWDDQETLGAGTSSVHNANKAQVTLSVANLTVGKRVRQTFQRFPYIPGKAQQIAMTGIIGSPAIGVIKRLGYFDEENGCFFEMNPTGMNVGIRSSTTGAPVDILISQTSWNADKLNGLGPSGITADWEKAQIFGIEFQWLGVGETIFSVNVGGQTVVVHREQHANILGEVYMSTPNLPCRYEISNDGSGGNISLVQICSAVVSSGGTDGVGISRTIYRETALTTLDNSDWYPLIAIRLKSGYFGSRIHLNKTSVACTSSAAFLWKICLNPTIVGTALAYSSVTNSGIESDLTVTNATTITGGIDLHSGVILQTNESNDIQFTPNGLRLGANIAGTSDVLVLAVKRLTGTTESFYSTLSWLEQK